MCINLVHVGFKLSVAFEVFRDLHLIIDMSSYHFSDIRNWIRNIEQHASDNVNKILVGNKADMDESKRVCCILRLLSFKISLVKL